MEEDSEEEQDGDDCTQEVVQVEVRLALMIESAKLRMRFIKSFNKLNKFYFCLEMLANGDGGLTPGCELSK